MVRAARTCGRHRPTVQRTHRAALGLMVRIGDLLAHMARQGAHEHWRGTGRETVLCVGHVSARPCWRLVIRCLYIEGDNIYVYESKASDGQKITQAVRATKRIQFSSMPKALLVQLKRFDRANKLGTAVRFEEKLDLGPFCHDSRMQQASEPCEYTLIGVVMHEGTATAGHYWAFVRTEANAWFRCDDAVVEEAELTRVLEEGRGGPVEASAYLLLYRQC